MLLFGCSSDEPLGLGAGGKLSGTDLADPFAGGEYLESVPFLGEGSFPTGVRDGQSLDGRLAVDLSQLESLQVSNEDFFIRSFAPDGLASDENWSVKIHGAVAEPVELGLAKIREMAEPMGQVLMECAGNAFPLHFGLISSAEWTGVPIAKILELTEPEPYATRLLISGFDGKRLPSTHSTPGASWVFSPEQLKHAEAFLAVEMNGEPLSADHGAPVRLVVPGWYGCTCIKWLNEIKWVTDNEPATAQMQEFAKRTHQEGIPEYAADYSPASIDRTAAPIRVERWRLDGRSAYRVVGLTWGASVASGELAISMKPGEDYVPVTASGPLTSGKDWAFWSHRWEPSEGGQYRIRLKLLNSDAPTRRLDMRWYARNLELPKNV